MNMSYWNNLTLEQRQKIKSYLYKIEKQKQIIEKAIEFINEYAKYNKITINHNKYYDEYILNNVIDILNGRSDE